MTSSLKRKVALKGQSRSKFCALPTTRSKTSAPCLRLAGHKGKHRPTTMRSPKGTPAVVEPTTPTTPTPEPKAPAAKKSAKRRSAKRRPLSKTAAGALAQAVEDGTVTASEALSRVAASQRGRRNRPVRVATK